MAKTIDHNAPNALTAAADLLRAGALVALPTETVYGLAADATNPQAVAGIYSAKGRPSFNPLISHVSSREMLLTYAQVPAVAELLMAAFWPGPLTLVLEKATGCALAPAVTAGLTTAAFRMPKQDFTLRLIASLGRPVAAPSANTSGKLSPTCASDVQADLGERVPLIIDGGPCGVGIESTIIHIHASGEAITLLRPGTLTADEISAVAGMPVQHYEGSDITAPGQITSHYAPNASLRLNAHTPEDGEVYIGFGASVSGPVASNIPHLTLSPAGDLSEAARTLFSVLRAADTHNKPIAVAPIPNIGIGLAVNDRLSRAAAPRITPSEKP